MRYFTLFPFFITEPDRLFKMAAEGTAKSLMLVNIVILGVLFGISNLIGVAGQEGILDMSGGSILILVILLIIFGIVTMCGALIALCLIYWAAAKALGGRGGMTTVLELLGVASVPFWILAPLLNYLIRYTPRDSLMFILMMPLVVAFAWSFIVLRKSMVVGQGLSEGRATLAVGMIWLFSVSAVYVLVP